MSKKDIDFWQVKQERQEARKYWAGQRFAEQEEREKDEWSHKRDMKSTCKNCNLIRSALEVVKGICENCDCICHTNLNLGGIA